ncbi:MAG: helix-turn-helix domain-containing protein, partial [Carboxylicivirga sp.]|nr:helix-turn-helix domain-containing protein [Carboxylicivirga sp.]
IVLMMIFFCIKLSAQNHSFNARPHYVNIKANSIPLPYQQITVECWLKPNTLTNWVAPLSWISDNGSDESGFALAYYNNKLRFMLKTETMRGNEWNYNPGAPLEMNQWSHVAGTYDGEYIRFYLNGELIDSKQTTGLINWDFKPQNLQIGVFKDINELSLFDGLIDEVRIWKTALSHSDIKNYRYKSIVNPTDDLIAFYNFDQLDKGSIVVPDLSKYKNDGHLNIPANEETLVQSGAMIIPVITNLELLSPCSFKVAWESSESIHNYDHYIVEIAKDRAFNQIISSKRCPFNEFTFENVPGGTMVYLRIKGFSNEIGYTSYSAIREITDFRTGLSVMVTNLDDTDNIQHRLVNNNQISTNYLGLPTQVRNLRMDFALNNETPENIRTGKISIEGSGKIYETTFSKNTDVTLFNVEPGIYHVNIEWGSIGQDTILRERLTMEVKRSLFETYYFKGSILVLLLMSVYFFLSRYSIVNKNYLTSLKKKLAPKENTPDWIEPELLESNAMQIKEVITTQKLYLDPKFNLKSLASLVDIPHYQVSKILNDYYRTNFNDFINEFRVKEFVRILNESKQDNIKNSALAYQCGFYSESTFFRAFKKFMGKSPQQYRKEMTNKEQ